MRQGGQDKETGRQGDKEILRQSDSFALSPSFHVSLSIAFGGVAAVALGWIAAKLNIAGFAPVGLLPVAIGIALGAVVHWLARAAGATRTKWLILTSVVLAILTVLAEHAWLYRDFCRQWRESRASHAQVAMFRSEAPWSPLEYFANEATPSRVALWCVDAALVVAGSVATVSLRRRRSPTALGP
jgi:hypothetical protein